MPTFIKTGFWEKTCQTCNGYKGWLNLDDMVNAGTSGTSGTSGLSGTSGVSGTSGISGSSGTSGTLTDAYHGSFYSIVDQSTTNNGIKAMEYEVTDLSSGVSITNNLSSRPTRITFANAGVYNIQFSAQLHNTDGGGSSVSANIWLAVDSSNVANSNTRVSVTPNSPYMVAAWNFFVSVTAGQYAEIMWSPNVDHLIIEFEAAGTHPAIPSVILTANRIA